MTELETAMRQGFLELGVRRRNSPLVLEWYTWCRTNNRPWALVLRGSRYSSVEMDLYNTPLDLTEEQVTALKEKVIPFMKVGSTLASGSTFWALTKVRNEDASAVMALMLKAGLEGGRDIRERRDVGSPALAP